MAGITVPIDGDLSPILSTFAELPGRTQEEMAAVGAVIEREARRGAIAKGFAEVEGVSASSAKRAANAVVREMERAAQEAKKANEAAAREAAAAAKAAEREIERAMETAAREAAHAAREVERAMDQAQRESAARFGDLRRGATVAFGGVVGDVEDVIGALGAMGPAGAAAGVALAGVAIVAASAWAESQVLQYLYDAASATGALTDEQAALKKALEDINLTVGTRVAPIFEGLLVGAVGATLAFGDFVSWLIRTRDAAIDFYDNMNPILKFLGAPILLPLEAGSRLDQIAEEMKSGSVEADSYLGRARALIGTMGETEKATERATEATHSHAAAHHAAAAAAKDRSDAAGKAALAEIQADQDLTDQILANIVSIDEARIVSAEKLAELNEKQRQQDLAAFHDEYNRIVELQLARAQATQEYLLSGIAAAATLAQAVADSAEEGSAAQQAAAIAAFRLNQAGSIGTIAINTAEAITKAIALFGPPPSPAGIAGISFATAIGLAQAAAVAAQAPPSFHTGGVIASNPLAPDETMIVARKGEEVRTRQEQGAGANVTVQMVYQHRIFDSFVMDNMRQAGSPLRREIHKASGRRVGHRG